MSSFWSTVVNIVIFLNIIGGYLLIRWVAKPNKGESKAGETTGHIWDDNLAELNNPMPMWWLYLFYISIIFALVYVVLYPGFSQYEGLLKWTSVGQYEEEVAKSEEKYGPLFSQFSDTPIEELSKNEDANKVGQRLFVTYCAQCHGSDAGGTRGYPNLTDNEWIWGGEASDIEHTILNGRDAAMPAWGSVLKPNQVEYVADYLFSLSGRPHKATDANRGKKLYDSYCVTCHMSDATGNKALGAPNLVDDVWLYGASRNKITESISKGRLGKMPPHKNFLGEDKVHVLAAYVYSLSNK
ncbi:MAG: cytochrome-c oxidase, cbb3-type subunit III [Cycloclasticus sp.]|nr:cytochrome-c oxidase, cbb3-type subunit III [Cycloclasticus sp.]